MAWIYIIIAALFETAWTYSVKALKFNDFILLTWSNFYRLDSGIIIISPLVGYIVFGVVNVYFFSLALKQLPAATTYACWTGATLILLKITDTLVFHQSFSLSEIFFLFLIMSGVMGLKFGTTK